MNETLSYSYDDFDACLEGNSKRQNQDKQLISKLMRDLEVANKMCIYISNRSVDGLSDN